MNELHHRASAAALLRSANMLGTIQLLQGHVDGLSSTVNRLRAERDQLKTAQFTNSFF
jgi:hypothetical protein